MRNTVVQHTAMNLTNNAYMNSTTKFVKGMNINPQFVENNKNPTIIASSRSTHQFQKVNIQQQLNTPPLPSSSLHPKQLNQQSKSTDKHQEQSHGNSAIAMIAMNLSANIFMNSTTKFVKGFADLSPLNTTHNQKKHPQVINQMGLARRQKQQMSISAVQHRSTQKIGLEMTAANYMTSTTKYLKQGKVPQSPKQAICIAQKSISTLKLHQTLNRNRLKTENELKDRTQELKFIQHKYTSQSQSTIKDHHQTLKTTKVDGTKQPKIQIQKESNPKGTEKIIVRKNETNNKKSPISLTNIPPRQTNRHQIREIRSSDTRQLQKKQESQRPFARQPQHTRPLLITTQRVHGKEIQQNPMQIEQQNKRIKKIERVKSQTAIGSEELLLQTPNKNQVVPKKQLVRVKPVDISTIKEQASMAHNTKISVQIRPIKSANQQLRNNETPKIKQSPNSIKNIQSEQTMIPQNKQKQSAQLSKIRSVPQIKVSEKLQQTIAIPPKRPIINKNNPENQIAITRLKEEPIPKDNAKTSRIKQETTQAKAQGPTHIAVNRQYRKQPEMSNKRVKTQNQYSYLDQYILKASPPTKKIRAPIYKIQQGVITDSKKQTSKQNDMKQNVKQDHNPSASILRSSKMLGFLLQKWYSNTLLASFNSIKSAACSRVKHSQQASILCYQISNLYQHLCRFQLRSAFEALKKQYLFQTINIKVPMNTNTKHVASNLIFRCIKSKLRQWFQSIKLENTILQHIHSPQAQLPPLRSLQAQQSKASLLLQVTTIIGSYYLEIKRKSFHSIYSQSLRSKATTKETVIPQVIRNKPQKPVRNYQMQKQNSAKQKAQLQSSITFIESRISDKKYYSDLQKGKLIKKQTQLMHKSKLGENESLQKRKRNKELNAKIEQLGSPSDLDITLPQSQPLVNLLADIYSWVFGSTNDKFNVQNVREKYSLNKQDQNPLLKEWQAISNHCKLRCQLSIWQRQGGVVECYKKMLGRKQIGEAVLRSYIQQRYLWQCVKTNADRL